MDTPEDSQLENAKDGKENDLENRLATMHDTRKGLTLIARVDEDHMSVGGFLTSRRELETLPPGEPRLLQLAPNVGLDLLFESQKRKKN